MAKIQFNVASEKIVQLDEFVHKVNARYKQELSFTDQLFLNLVDRPLSMVAGMMMAFKIAAEPETRGAGFLIDPITREKYVDGSALNLMMNNMPYSINKKFDQKLCDIAVRTFNECEDYSFARLRLIKRFAR